MWARYGMTPTERWIADDALGIRVRALEHGEGRPVIFIHGTPTAGGVFVPLVGHLSGVRAIVVDRPGCGLSEGLDFTGFTPERMREIIDSWAPALVASVSQGPVDVVASSAGGLVALVIAARHPELIRSVALLGAPAVEGMNLPLWMRVGTFAPVARAVSRHHVNERDLRMSFKSMGHGDLVRNGGLSQEDLEWRYALSRDTPTYSHEMQMMRLAASWRGPRPGWVASPQEIAALASPSLWVAGANDPFASPERISEWASHARDSTVQVMPGAGHQPWIDDPKDSARRLEQWWESLDISGAPNGIPE
jgi:pimeloyl-ACP methyl ester carboxylesterase